MNRGFRRALRHVVRRFGRVFTAALWFDELFAQFVDASEELYALFVRDHFVFFDALLDAFQAASARRTMISSGKNSGFSDENDQIAHFLDFFEEL